jgi:flagellar hook-associated protein 2
MAGLSLSGLASGLDWKTLVDQLVDLERTPQTVMAKEQATIRTQSTAYKTIQNSLNALKLKTDALSSGSLFTTRKATTSDSSVLSATTASGAAVGNYKVTVGQLSKSAVQQGTSDVGSALSATNDVAGLKLSDAGFSTAVSAGKFTVNGKEISIATSDSLQDVFDKVSTATGGVVNGSYDAASDKISFSSSGTLLLGATTDTSNFLQVAKLYNNPTGTGTVTSAANLGSVRLDQKLASANFATAVSDGGSGSGSFKVNGVEIAFDAANDSVSDLLKRINNSTAGVTASYDAVNDRFSLTNKTGGDVGISLEDVTGNFLAASGLGAGTLVRGKDMQYSVNDGPTLYARGSVIGEESSGIPGLSVTVVKEGTATVDVSTNTGAVKTAINDFLTAFNALQDTIDTYTRSSTDSAGKVTASALSNDNDATEIGTYLRRTAFGDVSGLSGTINRLEKLGISTNGDNNKLALADSAKLDDVIANRLSDVEDFFTNKTKGLAVGLSAYLDRTVGDDGSLPAKQDRYTDRIKGLDDQIAAQERQVQARKEQWLAAFQAMETAQSKSNQQLQYLTQNFGK